MKKNNKENKFLIVWVMCVMLLVGVCNLGFIRGTRAAFGNVTGQLSPPKKIEYISNYPSELGLEEEVKSLKQAREKYIILENSFILEGYDFVNWNTVSDGSGDSYASGTEITLKGDITFYAQWRKIGVEVITYGDSNLDGVINADDYLLIEKYINEGITLEEQGVINADVNQDGKIDLIDADIIKQVCLGTDGYVGKLPLEPIYVYEIYGGNNMADGDDSVDDGASNEGDGETDSDDKDDENINNDNDNNKNEDDSLNNDSSDNDSSDNSSSGSGGGTGSSGSGTGSSGSTGGGKKPSGGSNKPSNDDNKKEDKEDNKIEDDTENKDNNNVDDSEDKEEDKNNIVNKIEDKKRVSYVGIIVFVICILSLRLIIYVIDKFRKKQLNRDDEESKK